MKWSELYKVAETNKRYKCLHLPSSTYLMITNKRMADDIYESTYTREMIICTAARWLVYLRGSLNHDAYEFIEVVEEEANEES